jgi:hypothetical protein
MAAAGLAPAFAPNARTLHREPLRGVSPPSLPALNRSIASATSYIEALYRPLGDGRAVTSEYYALPLRVYLPRSHRWFLVGEADATSVVSKTVSGYADERDRVAFGRALDLAVHVNWRQGRNRFAVTLRQLGPVNQPVQLYLASRPLGAATPGRALRTWRIVLSRRDRALLGSFRYTVRHGAQLAQNFYRYRHWHHRFAATVRLIRGAGLRPNRDLTAPIWGRGVQLPDSFPFDPNEAYHDCDVSLPSTPAAYPYRSKVCATSRSLYIWLTHSDPLAPTVAALHALERDHDPDRTISEPRLPIAVPVGADPHAAEPPSRSPRQTAAWLESLYRATGSGIPRCLPAYCERTSASGVRTFEFGALEAMLGYRDRDTISRSYADSVAALALRVQVAPDGIIHADQGPFYRPAAAGSFYLGWDHDDRAHLTDSLLSKVTNELNMPPEYTGIITSNSESTITAYAFLVAYRCVRYDTGCDRSSALMFDQPRQAPTPPHT